MSYGQRPHKKPRTGPLSGIAASSARQSCIYWPEPHGIASANRYSKTVCRDEQRQVALHVERLEATRLDKQRHAIPGTAGTGNGQADSANAPSHETTTSRLVGALLVAAGLRPANGHQACGFHGETLSALPVKKQNVTPSHGNTKGSIRPSHGNTEGLVLPPAGSIRGVFDDFVLPPAGGYLYKRWPRAVGQNFRVFRWTLCGLSRCGEQRLVEVSRIRGFPVK